MKTISSYSFKGKKVLLRTDINSDVKDGKVLMSERIKEAAVSIKELKKKKAKVVVVAHQGNPGKSDFVSLEQHSKLLNKFVKIRFVKCVAGKEAIRFVDSLKKGEAILLENLRFVEDEFKPEKKNNSLIEFAKVFDYYVNDAFSVCHREHTSIVGFPRVLKSCAGRILEREVNAIKRIKIKKCLYILGGAKPSDNVKLLRGNKVISCGLFGQICLIAKGKNFGFQNRYLEKEKILTKEIVQELKKKLRNVLTPVDFAVKINGKRVEMNLEDFPNDFEIYDIGQKTINLYVREIKKSKAIYMKGPAGDCSDQKFSKGTFSLLKAISESKGFTVIGGGHLSDAIRDSKIPKNKFGHISLSGGALLSYIAGEKLPGLIALKID